MRRSRPSLGVVSCAAAQIVGKERQCKLFQFRCRAQYRGPHPDVCRNSSAGVRFSATPACLPAHRHEAEAPAKMIYFRAIVRDISTPLAGRPASSSADKSINSRVRVRLAPCRAFQEHIFQSPVLFAPDCHRRRRRRAGQPSLFIAQRPCLSWTARVRR